jgi:hypothetical protein
MIYHDILLKEGPLDGFREPYEAPVDPPLPPYLHYNYWEDGQLRVARYRYVSTAETFRSEDGWGAIRSSCYEFDNTSWEVPRAR